MHTFNLIHENIFIKLPIVVVFKPSVVVVTVVGVIVVTVVGTNVGAPVMIIEIFN